MVSRLGILGLILTVFTADAAIGYMPKTKLGKSYALVAGLTGAYPLYCRKNHIEELIGLPVQENFY